MSDATVAARETSKPSPRRILVVSGFGMLFDSMDVGLISYVLVSLSKLWHLHPQMMGLIGSIGFVGMAIGSALAGSLADKFGRRNIFMWTLLIYCIATGLSALATSIAVFLLLRFIVGFGLGGELPVATTYVLESSREEVRGRRVVLLTTFWAIGSLIAALISFFVIPSLGWRLVFVIGAIPALYIFVLRFSLPETPRYQSLTTRPGMRESFQVLWQKGIARRSVVTWLLWFIMNFSYYGMFLWLPSVMALKGYSLVHSIGYVLIMTLAQVPGYLCAAWLVEKLGRKTILVISMLFSALSALGFGFANSTLWLIIFGLLLSFFTLAAFAATYIFTVEQFPTRARGSGMGFAAGFGRIGGIIAPYLTGALIAAHYAFPAIFGLFFIVTLIGFFIVLIFGIETMGKQIHD